MLRSLTFTKWHVASLLFCLLFIASYVDAATDFKSWQIHGFVTQSYTKTTDNQFYGNSSGKGSLDFTEIGINASVKPFSNLQLASQLLSRRAGEIDNGDIKLDFALVDYRLFDDTVFGMGVRAGRVKNPIGFYNETRDVLFTRESIVLPQSIYFERARDVSLSSDGFHFYGHLQTPVGLLNGQFGIALPRVSTANTEYALLGDDKPGSFISEPSFVGRLRLDSINSRLSVAFSYIKLNMEYEPKASEAGFSGNSEVSFDLRIFSIRYNMMKWSFTSEYAQRRFMFTGMPYIPPPANNKVGESLYFQSIYRFSHRWQYIARYDVLFSDRHDRNGEAFVAGIAALGQTVNAFSRYAKDFMLGVQLNISPNWMARLEAHSVDGTAWLPSQDNPDPALTKRYWNMVNIAMSYRF